MPIPRGRRVGDTLEEVLQRAEPERTIPPWADVSRLWKLPLCPSLATLFDHHLRAIAVFWTALGGATIPEIISVTGHTAASAGTILNHDLARHPEMADAAIGKMSRW